MKKVEKLDIEIVKPNSDETIKASKAIFQSLNKVNVSNVSALTALCICTVEFSISCGVKKKEFTANMNGFWDELEKVREDEQ